jgi:hypothetical protein
MRQLRTLASLPIVDARRLARDERAARTPEQLPALLTDHLQPCGLPAALGSTVALI